MILGFSCCAPEGSGGALGSLVSADSFSPAASSEVSSPQATAANESAARPEAIRWRVRIGGAS